MSWFDNEIREIENTVSFVIDETLFNFVNELYRITRLNKITRKELARRTNLTKKRISQIMNYTDDITLRELAVIAHALGLRWTIARLVPAEDVSMIDCLGFGENH